MEGVHLETRLRGFVEPAAGDPAARNEVWPRESAANLECDALAGWLMLSLPGLWSQ